MSEEGKGWVYFCDVSASGPGRNAEIIRVEKMVIVGRGLHNFTSKYVWSV